MIILTPARTAHTSNNNSKNNNQLLLNIMIMLNTTDDSQTSYSLSDGHSYMDNRGNSRINTCAKTRLLLSCLFYCIWYYADKVSP